MNKVLKIKFVKRKKIKKINPLKVKNNNNYYYNKNKIVIKVLSCHILSLSACLF